MSLIWKFEEDVEMVVQFHVDMFHSIPENETVKKIATWKTRHNTDAESPVIPKSVFRNIVTYLQVFFIVPRTKERLGDCRLFLSRFAVSKLN
jgi:hypothetical protein